MSIFTNKKHFLHQHVTFLESTGIDGKDGGHTQFLTSLGLPVTGSHWDIDHATVDWNTIKPHYQFFFDYENNEQEITTWLQNSKLVTSEYLYTWLDWNDPIIKIKTIEFIRNWEAFYIASVEGMVVITIDGSKYLEFTDDWKYKLHSNFEIKPTL